MLDVAAIKQAAARRWPDILCRIGGLDSTLLDGKHHPCIKCGGKDRFRMLDSDTGALYCNQCFNTQNGDGIAAVMWLTGLTFQDALSRIAEEVGHKAEGQSKAKCDVIQEMAWRKGVSPESLKAYGATIATRGGLIVCRVPMHNADMQQTGFLDLAPSPEGFDKGKMTQGSRHGLFVAEKPESGQTICLVEGVKDAAALHALGIAAIGLPTCRMDASFARMFRGCKVTIIPDRDKAGLEGAEETAARLHGVADEVAIAELPMEFKETGGPDVRDTLRTRDGEAKLREAIDKARAWSPAAPGDAVKFTELVDAVDALIQRQGTEEPLIKLGLPDIDYAIGGGVLPGEMIIIAGRPSHGKTTAALQALDALSKIGPVLMLSEEMSCRALASRTLTGITELPESEWVENTGRLAEQAVSHFNQRHPMWIAESSITTKRAVEVIAKAKRDHGIVAVAVDYVQMLKGMGQGRYEQVSDTSTKLKQAAVKHDLIMLAVCQLNRGIESRQTTSPRMSDLRDSGQLEQDADVILFVEWLHRSNPEAHRQTEYRICVGKNRNRPIMKSVIECVFLPERQRLHPMAWQSGHAEPEPWSPPQEEVTF